CQAAFCFGIIERVSFAGRPRFGNRADIDPQCLKLSSRSYITIRAGIIRVAIFYCRISQADYVKWHMLRNEKSVFLAASCYPFIRSMLDTAIHNPEENPTCPSFRVGCVNRFRCAQKSSRKEHDCARIPWRHGQSHLRFRCEESRSVPPTWLSEHAASNPF